MLARLALSAALATLLGCSAQTICQNCFEGDGGGGAGAGSVTGSGPSGSGPSGSGGAAQSSGSGAAAGAGGEWTTLITGSWELDPGSENTSDIHTTTLGEDMYVRAIRPIAPPGTHHAVLARNGFDMDQLIYASGVGTNALYFPAGVGLRLPAGEPLVLQLHLFNPSGQTLTGISGIEVIVVDAAEIEEEAEIFLPGPMGLAIPANQSHTQSGTCTVDDAQHLFALFPHMHQLGTHFKTTIHAGGVATVIHDGAYDFAEQAIIGFDPIALAPGDSIETECTWNNTTPDEVGWGESSTSEMCFSILYRYPLLADQGFCGN